MTDKSAELEDLNAPENEGGCPVTGGTAGRTATGGRTGST